MQLHHALRLPPEELSVTTLVGAGGKTSALFRLADEAVAEGRRVVTTTTTRIFATQADRAPTRLVVGLEENTIDWAALEANLAAHGHCLLVTSLAGLKYQGLPAAVVDALAARADDFGIRLIAVEGDGSRRRSVEAPAPYEPVIPNCTTHLIPVVGLDGLGLPLAEPYVQRPERLRALLQEPDPATRLTPRMIARLVAHPYRQRSIEPTESPDTGRQPASRACRQNDGDPSLPTGGERKQTVGARLAPLLDKADSAPWLAAARQIAHQLSRQNQPTLIGAVGSESQTAIRERWGPTTAVVLAAGESRRMGKPKQLLWWQGEPLVARAARVALQSGASEAVVITGAVGEQVEAALEALRRDAGGRLRVVFNPNWQDGQAESVRVAVGALSVGCEAALFFPVDQPRLPVALLRRLWQVWRAGSDLGAVSVAGALRGAPAVFDRRFFGALEQLQGDRGGGGLLQQRSADVISIETPPHWLADVDTPEDWQALA